MLILIGSLGISSYLINSNTEINGKKVISDILTYVWTLLLFIFIGIEAIDYFRSLLLISFNSDYQSIIKFAQPIIIAVLWMLYSLVILYYGLKRNSISFKITGTLFYLISLILVLVTGLIFEPLRLFIPVFNLRFMSIGLFIASTILLSKWIKEYKNNIKTIKIDYLVSLLRYLFAVLLFILITVEINDYFSKKFILESADISQLVKYYKPLILAFVWTIFSVAFVYLGTTKKLKGYIVLGFISLTLSLLFGLLIGHSFIPIEYYTPGLNLRFITLTAIVIGIILIISYLKREKDLIPLNSYIIKTLTILTSILLFLTLTFELNDFYQKETIALSSAAFSDHENEITFLKNQKQIAISTVWLLYSIILMLFGIFKRIKVIRLTAMCLFGISIIKIFVIDLSFLDQPYRIISFIGLGLILLFVSFLYQKYQNIIMMEDK
jgi:uncharacterized membrane protein